MLAMQTDFFSGAIDIITQNYTRLFLGQFVYLHSAMVSFYEGKDIEYHMR